MQRRENTGKPDPRSPGNLRPPGAYLLLVEPDPLTRWSLQAYLQRWFTVAAVTTTSAATGILRQYTCRAVVVSDQIPFDFAAVVARTAREVNPAVHIVLLVTGDSEPRAGTLCTARIEKPFVLGDLARLVGVSEDDLAA